MISTLENVGGTPDTGNLFLVGVRSQDGRIVIGLLGALGAPLPKTSAINLAAWLVVLADPEQKEFQRMLEAIKNT
jgi:hypothetical protein